MECGVTERLYRVRSQARTPKAPPLITYITMIRALDADVINRVYDGHGCITFDQAMAAQ